MDTRTVTLAPVPADGNPTSAIPEMPGQILRAVPDDEISTVKKIMMVIGDEVRSSLTRTPTFQVGPKQARHHLTANEEIFYLTIVGGAHKILDLHSSTTNFGTLGKKLQKFYTIIEGKGSDFKMYKTWLPLAPRQEHEEREAQCPALIRVHVFSLVNMVSRW
eukprot:CAMPEP_0115075902 /NCGR_PEP_ID=MMETSP0227-20121206/16130_1 /TAXON_ID=89957 /ORGANISM="Polarella glacialis, Strain CCMP 1383" /LENGTH=161 /DNA_ID=CAMNT_0002462985 /DNA_START=125 /DNA_END=608 /DNA_ORIENTATION=-